MCFLISRTTPDSTRRGGKAAARRAPCLTVASWTAVKRSAERRYSRDHTPTAATRPGSAPLLARQRSTSSRSALTSAGRKDAAGGKQWKPSARPTATPSSPCLWTRHPIPSGVRSHGLLIPIQMTTATGFSSPPLDRARRAAAGPHASRSHLRTCVISPRRSVLYGPDHKSADDGAYSPVQH